MIEKEESSVGGQTILELEHVSKQYGGSDGSPISHAVRDASFSLSDTEFVSIVGPSGCGKTTLLKLCAGLTRASSGTIDYMGTMRPSPPGTYGFVFQNSTLLPWLTILNNILLPARILGLEMGSSTVRARELLQLVKLDGTERKYPRELSGGMQQRVAIARALLPKPKILFMDEPFGALDYITRERLNVELQRLHAAYGSTVLLVTHSVDEALFLSDRVLVMPGNSSSIREVRVPVPRPRNFADVESTALFTNLRRSIKTELEMNEHE